MVWFLSSPFSSGDTIMAEEEKNNHLEAFGAEEEEKAIAEQEKEEAVRLAEARAHHQERKAQRKAKKRPQPNPEEAPTGGELLAKDEAQEVLTHE